MTLNFNTNKNNQHPSFSNDLESIYRLTFDNLATGLAITDLNGKFIKINRRLCEVLGYTQSELLDLNFTDLAMPEDIKERLSWSKSILSGKTNADYTRIKRYRHKLGHLIWAKMTASLVKDEQNNPSFFIYSLQDIVELKDTEEALDIALVKLRNAYAELDRLSSLDLLSGAQKYEATKEQILFSIEEYKRHKTLATLVVTNIDGLKEINKEHGKIFGDRALRAVATRLIDEARNNDSVCRYFEDEFIIVLPNTNFRQALDYFQRISDRVEFRLENGDMKKVDVSIGASQISDQINTVNDWITEAKSLMFEQKLNKKTS